MGTFLTNSVPGLATFSGKEAALYDTNLTGGSTPQQVGLSLYKLALLMTTMLNTLNKTMVAGTIYYTQINIGVVDDLGTNDDSYQITGLNIPVGTTGGTDTWYVGLYNSAGVLVAQGSTSGVTAGTASTIQQIPFYGSAGTTLGPVTVVSGTYYMALQSNGTTATFKAINSPVWPYVTGSQTGSAGTLAAISALATTYTANVGPAASLY